MRISHISITARNAEQLAAFYRSVFRFTEKRAAKTLSGPHIAKGNGLPDMRILSIWLHHPDSAEPFLELMEYAETADSLYPEPNAPGLAHLAISVDDLDATLAELIAAGGQLQGEVTNFGTDEAPIRIVYARDPEGNILELEQNGPP